MWCPSFGECDVSQDIGIISVECTASTIKQPGRATHLVMGQIHSQNPKPERPHMGHFNFLVENLDSPTKRRLNNRLT